MDYLKKGFGSSNSKKKAGKPTQGSCIKEKIEKAIHAYNRGELLIASEILEELIRQDERNSLALGLLGMVKRSQGNISSAISLFQKSISVDGGTPRILHYYSEAIEEQNPYESIKSSDKAILMDPTNLIYLDRNASIKQKLGDIKGATKSAMRITELAPNNYLAHLNLATLYKDLDELEKPTNQSQSQYNLSPTMQTPIYHYPTFNCARARQ